MQLRVSPRYRRAILIYVGTIVVPVAVFVWLVYESFGGGHRAADGRAASRFAPAAFDEAERLERTFPERALVAYRSLLAANIKPALALWRIGRCLETLGKIDEARDTWRRSPASLLACAVAGREVRPAPF